MYCTLHLTHCNSQKSTHRATEAHRRQHLASRINCTVPHKSISGLIQMTKEAIYRRESSWAPRRRWEMTRKWKFWQHVDTDLLSACARYNEKYPNKLKKSHSFCLFELMTELMSWWSDFIGGLVHHSWGKVITFFTLWQRASRSNATPSRLCKWGRSCSIVGRVDVEVGTSAPEAKMTYFAVYIYLTHLLFRISDPLTRLSYGEAALHN